MLELTKKQDEYLQIIDAGPMTIQDVTAIVRISEGNVSRRIGELRDMGLVKSVWKTVDRRRVYYHTLIRSYSDLVERGFKVIDYPKNAITEEEIQYAGYLTDEKGLTGLRRLAAYQKRFPHRTLPSLKNTVTKAKRRHLCR